MPTHFVICYRHEDSSIWAQQLCDHLALDFVDSQMVAFHDKAEPNSDLERQLEDCVSSCAVCLLIIGRNWLNARTVDGQRRLDNPADIVRRVTDAALKEQKRIIPILVEGAIMPPAAELPATLEALSSRQALMVGYHLSPGDMRSLALAIREGREGDLTPKRTNFIIASTFLVVAPQASYIIGNKLVTSIDDRLLNAALDEALFDLWDWRILIAAVVWLVSFIPACSIGYWLVKRRRKRMTEQERTIFFFAGLLLGASFMLAALQVVSDDFGEFHPKSLGYLAGLAGVFTIIGIIAFRRFIERGAELSQLEWATASAATFVWTYFASMPIHSILTTNKYFPVLTYKLKDEVIQIGAALAMALIIVFMAKWATRGDSNMR
jgi:TIR domain